MMVEKPKPKDWKNVDEILKKVGYPTTTPNRLFEEAQEADSPLLDKMIRENHIKGVEV